MDGMAEYIVAAASILFGAISYVLKKEHQRIETLEQSLENVNARLVVALSEINVNHARDEEWRKRVKENHEGLKKADEDRRHDARNIYLKIEEFKEHIHGEIQRLAEMIQAKSSK